MHRKQYESADAAEAAAADAATTAAGGDSSSQWHNETAMKRASLQILLWLF
jgi:hypothetical protein